MGDCLPPSNTAEAFPSPIPRAATGTCGNALPEPHFPFIEQRLPELNFPRRETMSQPSIQDQLDRIEGHRVMQTISWWTLTGASKTCGGIPTPAWIGSCRPSKSQGGRNPTQSRAEFPPSCVLGSHGSGDGRAARRRHRHRYRFPGGWLDRDKGVIATATGFRAGGRQRGRNPTCQPPGEGPGLSPHR